ncbi:MAG: glycosyltransferase family 9 protein [Ignavibacteria bacterium]|nr:glycosyltransferase family 9 protein [Ignavibacteria bacterium]
MNNEISKIDKGEIKNILIIRKHNQIGDLIVSRPMFYALKKCFPNAKISLLASKTNYEIPFKKIIPLLDEVIIFNRSSLKTQLKTIHELRKRHFDIVIIPSTIRFSATALIVSFLSGIKIRVGISGIGKNRNKFSSLLNIKKNFDWLSEKTHQMFRNIQIVEQLGCKVTLDEVFSTLSFTEQNHNEKIKNLLESNLASHELIIGIHPGAGQTRNIWSTENFFQIIKRLKSIYNCGFVITSGQIDEAVLNKLLEKLKNEKINFLVAKNFEFDSLVNLINQCDLFISNDTGVMHIATMTNTNLIALMRKSMVYEWRPLGRNKFYISSPTEDINDISVDEVFELSKKILDLIMYKRKSI